MVNHKIYEHLITSDQWAIIMALKYMTISLKTFALPAIQFI